jgi:hypothetical protein
MKTIVTEIHIAASPERVWQVLTNFPEHANWDPFISSIEGEPQLDRRLQVRFRQGMKFRPRVTAVQPGRVLEWLGHLGIPGIFDGRHRFELEPAGAGTRLRQSEQFSGVLVPFIGKLLRDTEAQFAAMNRALKQQVERMVAT